MKRLLALLLLCAFPASAQQAATGQGALLRGLDKISGETVDFELRTGQSARVFKLYVTLRDCRYPARNPSGEAYAFMVIEDPLYTEVAFSGWMVASSPALNALDHSRYDIWVLRCMTS